VAEQAIEAGAEIINDISALRFDARMGAVAAATGAGLLLMHSRGDFETLHSQPPIKDILDEVVSGLTAAIVKACDCGIQRTRIALDIGIGFGKTVEQNLELIAKLDRLTLEFPEYPIAVGTSRKSFITKVVGETSPNRRLIGSVTTAAVAMWNGASIVRVHDVKETVEAARIVDEIMNQL
jgi:dihydropteroate synthase